MLRPLQWQVNLAPTFINRSHYHRIGGSTWCQRLLIIEVATIVFAGRVGANVLLIIEVATIVFAGELAQTLITPWQFVKMCFDRIITKSAIGCS